MPYYDGVVYRKGLGALTVHGSGAGKPDFLFSGTWFWVLCTGAAAAALTGVWRRVLAHPVAKTQWIFLAVSIAPAFCFLVGAKYFDCYMLQWTVGLLVFLPFFKPRSGVPAAAWALLAGMAAVSLIGARDYFIWNRAKWDLGMSAARFGIAPADVANGFDWNAHWHYDKNMAALRGQKPLTKIREWEWEPKENIKAVVTAAPDFYPADQLLQTATYYSLLARRGGHFYLFRRPPGDAKDWGH